MTAEVAEKRDIYETITNKIVAKLETGVLPWLQPWAAGHAAGPACRPLRHNGERYQGVNVLALWASADDQGYSCPYWLTFQQAKELGGSVRKGEKGSPVVYVSTFTKKTGGDEGEEPTEEKIPFLKSYTVFNAEQCDGLPERYSLKSVIEHREPMERDAAADLFFKRTGGDVRHGGNRAFYQIDTDFVQMPDFDTFRDPQSYYAVLAHEMTHWTRHPSRLNRDMGRKNWGDAGYAMEELVAELGSAFLCADLELTPELRDDHASYIECWLKVLKSDKRAIFTASSHAAKAIEFLKGLQPVE